MRKFIGGDGSDTTAAVQAYLAAHRELEIADLYVINTAPCYAGHYLGRTFLLTDYGSPLQWDYKGTFVTAVVSRGQVESKIGIETDTLEVNWSPREADILADDGGSPVMTLLTALQGFGCGLFDNAVVEVWRCLMPSLGDCNTLGACLLFAGRIGDIDPTRIGVKAKVVSLVDALNVMVPTNLIEPTNILAQYATGQLAAGAPSGFAVVSGSTAHKVYADGNGSPLVTMPAGTYDSGYIVFGTGAKLDGHYAAVREQRVESGHHAFYLYEPLPFAPDAGDALQAYIPVPRDYATAVANGSGYAGFPFVPSPISSGVVIA